jgi:hypothetical protein
MALAQVRVESNLEPAMASKLPVSEAWFIVGRNIFLIGVRADRLNCFCCHVSLKKKAPVDAGA